MVLQSTLSMHQITKSFIQGDKRIEVIKSTTISFVQGHTYAITGISGCGKSTFLQLLAGLDNPSSGKVYFNTFDLSVLGAEKELFLNRSIGLLFQQPYLLTELSNKENVMIPGLINSQSYNHCSEKANYLLGRLGLEHKRDEYPRSLSGGQQQRVALARALFNNPAFLLADEPTGNLDIKTGTDVINLLQECRKQWGMGIIVSTHDEYVTRGMDTIYRLNDGVIMCVKQ